MGQPSRFHFADEPANPQPRNYWVPRMLVTLAFVFGGLYANMYLGFRFW